MMIDRRALVLSALGTALVAPALLTLDRATAGEPPMPRTDLDPTQMTEAQWRAVLTPEQYRILRQKGTERAFSGEYWSEHADGTYVCAGCGAELFSSATKYDSGSGWPSFYEPIAEGRIATHVDRSLFMERIEITCAECGGHLGHVAGHRHRPRPACQRHHRRAAHPPGRGRCPQALCAAGLLFPVRLVHRGAGSLGGGRSRHWRVRAPISISTMLSQLAWVGA